jgi:hypothetical protein
VDLLSEQACPLRRPTLTDDDPIDPDGGVEACADRAVLHHPDVEDVAEMSTCRVDHLPSKDGARPNPTTRMVTTRRRSLGRAASVWSSLEDGSGLAGLGAVLAPPSASG